MSKGNKQRLKDYQTNFLFFLLAFYKMEREIYFLMKNILLKINLIYMKNQLILIK